METIANEWRSHLLQQHSWINTKWCCASTIIGLVQTWIEAHFKRLAHIQSLGLTHSSVCDSNVIHNTSSQLDMYARRLSCGGQSNLCLWVVTCWQPPASGCGQWLRPERAGWPGPSVGADIAPAACPDCPLKATSKQSRTMTQTADV